MASKINSRANLISMFHNMRIKGPVLDGEVFNTRFGIQMDTLEFSVSNHSKLPDPLPFGVFGEIINERNSNLSWVKVQVAKEFWDDPDTLTQFGAKAKRMIKIDGYMCDAIESTAVVKQSSYTPSTAASLWEEEAEQIDANHVLVRGIIIITGLNQYDDGIDAFNDELGVFVKTKRTLVNVYTAPALVTTSVLASYSYCVSIKCGWWWKITEEFTLSGGEVNYSYNTVVDHGFPPVLDSLPLYTWETKDGALRYYPQEVWLRSAFSGPCQATVAVKWKPTAITAPTITQIKPTSVAYNCPFFSINTGPCLHGLLEPHANIGTDDPDWAFQDNSELTILATIPTDWPDTLITDAPVTPYKGGYLMKTVTVTAPK